MNDDKYESIVNEAFSHELTKTEPPTLIQYIRSLRNNEFRKDELNKIFNQGPIIRDPETNEPYTNPLKLLGDGFDFINDQVTLKKLSPVLRYLPEDNMPNKLKDIINYSLKDLQYDVTGAVEKEVSGMTDNKFLGGLAAFGTALMIPDATDALFPGVADTVKYAKRIDTKRLKKILDGIFDGGSPFTRAVTPEGVEVPNTFFMSKSDDAAGGFISKSDDAAGGLRDFSKVTSPEYENIILSGMERMDMKDGIFDIDLYNQNSNILSEMLDTLGGSVMKSGMRRTKKLGKRNWMEYFLSPESLKGNFEALRKEGKIAANLEWEDFLKSKGLTVQDIQSHHINPLYDSIHLFDGVKWGSDEYWEIISELIGSGARPGIVQRGDDVTNVIRTIGKSSLTDTPHGIAHAYYKDIVPTFFSKSERDLMKLDPGYRLQKTKEWARIVNQSEDIVVKAHKAWTALNPKSRMPFDELVEEMAAYDNMGILKGISIKYQVKDIKEMVTQIQFEDIIEDTSLVNMMSEIEFEFMADVVRGLSKKDLIRKWGKKYNLKAIGAKQLDLFTK